MHLLISLVNAKLIRPCLSTWIAHTNVVHSISVCFKLHLTEILKCVSLQDTRSGIRDIGKFLSVDVTDDFIDMVTDRCHIDKMRRATVDVKDDVLNNFLIDGKPLMYRKGIPSA